MNNCVFCKISQKEIPTYILKETENFLSFLDIHPHAPGHSLVIPKGHYETISDLPENLGNEFIKIVKDTILLLSNSLQTKHFTLGINHGSLAGQAVLHLHFHIIPRFANDQGGSIHSVVKNFPKESLEEIYQKIKSYES